MGEEKTIPQQIEELRALLVEGFAALNKRVDTLTQSAPPETPQAPTRTDGLFRFVRPAVRDVTQWPIGVDMTTPDAEEAFQRSLHGVNWRGGHLSPQSYDEAWAEIDALKKGNPVLIAEYGPSGANLDPEFAGYALLVGLISPVEHDPETFGVAVSRRRSFAGTTIQSFMDDQIRVKQGGGGPGIRGE